MARPHLEQVPQFPIPEGWIIRSYRDGDQAHWVSIHQSADPLTPVDPGLFEKQFGEHRALLPERQLYLVTPDGVPAGTATAWFMGSPYDSNGRIHWVAIRAEFQGRGLAKPLLAAACRRLKELNHQRACLSTAALRRPAIELYLSFGFEPWIRDDGQQAVWDGVLAQLRTARPPAQID
jgi:GNAT superfamily N-acetyltransferase